MAMDNRHPVIQAEAKFIMGSLREYGDRVWILGYIADLVGDMPELDALYGLSVFDNGIIWLSLKQDCKDSPLVRRLVRRLNTRFKKTVNGTTLMAKGSVPVAVSLPSGKVIESLTFIVQNYLPESCRVETEEVEIPESEWVKTRKVSRVVCGSDEESSPTTPATAAKGDDNE